jgi:hypothetical protein
MPWPEVVLRAVLNIAAMVAIAFGLEVGVTAPLVLVAVMGTAELAVRPYVSNGADKLLLGCGATITILILTGLCLNLTPWGLTSRTWAVAWIIVSSAVLIWRRRLGSGVQLSAIRINSVGHWTFGLWGLTALVVFVAAGAIAMAGVRVWNQKPLLAFSLVSKNAHAVVVEIDATSTTGTYRIVADSGNRHANHYSSHPIVIRAGVKSQTIKESVLVKEPGRWIIYLNTIHGSSHLRKLIVDILRK